MSRSVKEVSAKSYISTEAYNNNFFTYTIRTGPSPQFKKTGALTNVSGATSVNCPAGNILRENGKKLFPDAYPGVTTYMVGVFDILNNLSGFINPNDPVFAPFNGDRPNYLKDSLNSVTKNLGAPVLTQGSVLCSGDVVSSGQVRSQDVTTLVTVDGTPNTANLDVSLGQVFKLTTTKAVTVNPLNILPGSHVYLIVTGGGAHAVTFGTGIKSSGALSATSGGVFVLHFICDNTSLFELGRTAALT
jgi:hypothetical protein